MVKYVWVKPKDKVRKRIKAKHDPIKEWKPDPKGYFLIRVDDQKKRIEVGYVTNKHNITQMIYGTNAIELYNTVVHEKLLTRLEHAAYLGKELYKAELALEYGKKYIQEFPLKFSDKIKMKLKKRS
jgi:dihydropteroate synthase